MSYTPTHWLGGTSGTEITSVRLNNLEGGVDSLDNFRAQVASAVVFMDPAAFNLTGSVNSSSAWQAFLDSIPENGVGVTCAGTILCSAGTVNQKNITLICWGTTFVQATNNSILTVTGSWGTPISVSSIASTDTADAGGSHPHTVLTLASTPPADWVAGTVIKLYSNDQVPTSRTAVSGTCAREGEFVSVMSVAGSTVTLAGGVVRGTYTTGIRVAKMNEFTTRIEGWHSYTPPTSLSTFTAGQLTLSSLYAPKVIGARVDSGGGHGVRFTSCWNPELDLVAKGLKNNAGGGQFGYAAYMVGGQGGHFRVVAENVRHAFTDNSSTIAADTADPTGYGRPRDATITGTAVGTWAAPWDTHSTGQNHRFVGVEAMHCPVGIQYRGTGHTFIDPKIINCTKPVWVFDEPDDTVAMTFEHYLRGGHIEGGALGIHVECLTAGSRYQLTVSDTYISASEQPVLLENGNIRFRGHNTVEFSTETTLGRKGIDALHARVRVEDGPLTLNMVPAGNPGGASDLYPIHLHDVDCRLTGPGLIRIYSDGISARVPFAVKGTNGSLPIIEARLWGNRTWASGAFDYATTGSWAVYHIENTGPAERKQWTWTGSAFAESAAP